MFFKKRKAEGTASVEKINENLKHYSSLSKEAVLKELDSSENGLSPVEANERLQKYGKNLIESGEQRSVPERIAEVLINPFNIVLLVVLFVTFLTNVVLATEKDWSTSILILSTITVSAIIGYTQEDKSSKAAAKLRKMIENNADVIRNGHAQSILFEEMYPATS